MRPINNSLFQAVTRPKAFLNSRKRKRPSPISGHYRHVRQASCVSAHGIAVFVWLISLFYLLTFFRLVIFTLFLGFTSYFTLFLFPCFVYFLSSLACPPLLFQHLFLLLFFSFSASSPSTFVFSFFLLLLFFSLLLLLPVPPTFLLLFLSDNCCSQSAKVQRRPCWMTPRFHVCASGSLVVVLLALLLFPCVIFLFSLSLLLLFHLSLHWC